MAFRQQSLFDTDPAPWELDDARQRLVASVVFPATPSGPFDYEVPDAMGSRLQVGCRVRVPFGRGNRPVVGYCVGLETRTLNSGGRRLKAVTGVVDDRSLLGPSMLRITQWMADYYLAAWGQVLQCVVPAAVREQAGTRQATLLSIPVGTGEKLEDLRLPPKQAQVLQVLAQSPKPLTVPQLAQAAGCTQAPITALRRKGLIEARVERITSTEIAERPVRRTPRLQLNEDQQSALRRITETLESRDHRTILIHGVTGSGKTEVYLQAIEKVVGFGRQAIVLVPEISLTPQTTARFR